MRYSGCKTPVRLNSSARLGLSEPKGRGLPSAEILLCIKAALWPFAWKLSWRMIVKAASNSAVVSCGNILRKSERGAFTKICARSAVRSWASSTVVRARAKEPRMIAVKAPRFPHHGHLKPFDAFSSARRRSDRLKSHSPNPSLSLHKLISIDVTFWQTFSQLFSLDFEIIFHSNLYRVIGFWIYTFLITYWNPTNSLERRVRAGS